MPVTSSLHSMKQVHHHNDLLPQSHAYELHNCSTTHKIQQQKTKQNNDSQTNETKPNQIKKHQFQRLRLL